MNADTLKHPPPPKAMAGLNPYTHRRHTVPHAMGLVELLLSFAMTTAILGGLILVSESLRTDTSEQQTRETLRKLRAALTQYHHRHGTWPPGASTSAAIKALLADPATAEQIKPLPLDTDPQGALHVRDGYGRPLRYFVETRGNTTMADFVSPGPDGQFGDLTSNHPQLRSNAMDNLFGSDMEAPTP